MGQSYTLLRILRAATVLAAVYTLGVFALFALFAVVEGWDFVTDDFWALRTPFAITMGAAFVVLAIARRIGFVLLWLVLVGLWGLMVFGGGVSDGSALLARGITYPRGLLFWSLLALPLFGMSSVMRGGMARGA